MARYRSAWSLWTQAGLRATSLIALLVSLGYMIYCSVKFNVNLVPGYATVWNSAFRVFPCLALELISYRMRSWWATTHSPLAGPALSSWRARLPLAGLSLGGLPAPTSLQ